MHHSLRPFFAFAVILVFASTAQGQVYTLTKLGTLPGGSYIQLTGINASGQILGYGDVNANGDTDNFIYQNGAFTDIGNPLFSVAGFNNGGTLVGSVNVGGANHHAATYSSGSVHDLGANGGTTADGFAINNSGQVTGYDFNIGVYNAFIYNGTATVTIGPDFAQGRAINDSGQVTGYYEDTNNHSQTFFYNGTGTITIGPLPGDNYSGSSAMNNAGAIIGTSGVFGSSDNNGFLYSGGTLTNLGHLGTGTTIQPNAINNHGTIVGSAPLDPDYNQTDAFIYWGGALHDLNTILGANVLAAGGFQYLDNAIGINDAGQIIGTGIDLNGNEVAFVLVPEPGVGALLAGAGALLLAGWRRRRASK